MALRAIDFHVHLPTPDWLDGSMAGYVEAAEAYFRSSVTRQSLEELAALYRGLEVKAVLLAWDAETATGRPRVPNETVAAACRDYPDVFTGLGSVDPHKGEAAVAEVENIAALGLRGVKFHPSLQAFAPDDPQYWPIFAACERHGLLALFHTGTSGIGARQPGGQGIRIDLAHPHQARPGGRGAPGADRGGRALRLAVAHGPDRHRAAQDQRVHRHLRLGAAAHPGRGDPRAARAAVRAVPVGQRLPVHRARAVPVRAGGAGPARRTRCARCCTTTRRACCGL